MKHRKIDGLEIIFLEESVFVSSEEIERAVSVVDESCGDSKVNLNVSSKNGKKKISITVHKLFQFKRKLDLMKKNIIPFYLKSYLDDFTKALATIKLLPLIGRDEEIKKIWTYLSQLNRKNVFVVGEADVGKTTIVLEIARKLINLEVPKKFHNHRLIRLNPEKILNIKTDTKKLIVIESIENFIKSHSSDIIIYIDDVVYMTLDDDLMRLLYKLIKKENIPIIMCTRSEMYNYIFAEDYFITKSINLVEVMEPEFEEIYPMLEKTVMGMETSYSIEITEDIVKFAIYTSVLANTVSCNPGRTLLILDQAATIAINEGKKKIDKECVLSCYDSYKKEYEAMSEEDKRIIAYHEAGHFLTLKKSSITGVKTACVSILPMMDFLGVNFSYHMLGKDLHKDRKYMIDTIAIYLGGRVAEKMVTKTLSSGASSDLEDANTLAEEMIIKYGLSKNGNNRSYILDEEYIKDYLLTDKDKEKINSEIISIIEEAYKRAKKILSKNRKILDKIVNILLMEEILTGEELDKIVASCEI